MLHFILNDQEVQTSMPVGTTVLDFIRYTRNLTGTKIGCREGDCGACTVLVGELKEGRMAYRSMTSCLMALGNAANRHVVTIDGININGLTKVQEAFAVEGATQCGFCTPGFIVSLTGFCIDPSEPDHQKAVDAVNGNICRCTGYKSIERAIASINSLMQSRQGTNALEFAVDQKIIPAYFLDIPQRMASIPMHTAESAKSSVQKLGGGTDLYVQQHEGMVEREIDFLLARKDFRGIDITGDVCEFGASTTVTDLLESAVFRSHFPDFRGYIKLVASTQIRNMATLAGNFVNASPIGDFTIFFLALDAQLQLGDGSSSHLLPLRDFYKGYKLLNKKGEEIIEKVRFHLPSADVLFNFEKVSKRTHLDIASVNTAIFLKMEEGVIGTARLSAGGVSPIPAILAKASSFMEGKRPSAEMLQELIRIADSEVAPISDARGTVTYKRLLLSQLIKAHFIKLFPELPLDKIISLHAQY